MRRKRIPEILDEYEIYGRIETWAAPLRLFAIGDANWDIYSDKTGTLYSIAKPGSGAGGSFFGNCKHVKHLISQGYWKDKFTPYGRELMKKHGYSI